MVNFFAFVIFSCFIGGDAYEFNQLKKDDPTITTMVGHYYVASHGQIAEVSQVNWIISNVLYYSFCITFPIGFISNIVYQFFDKSRDWIYQ